jgi:L-malate glycosyltransferase
MTRHSNVVILQTRMVHYRVPLFERMRQLCLRQGIDLNVVYGQPSASDEKRCDFADLPFGKEIRNRYFSFWGRELVWQGRSNLIDRADLVVMPQENRILSNYPILLRRFFDGRALAFWGHGRNFQSCSTQGIRERWKRLMVNRVDWWFTYTNLSAQTVQENGVPGHHITVLNNSIDTRIFRADLASVSDADLRELRARFKIDWSAPVVLYCGSLSSEKRLDMLVDASDRIRANIANLHLFVVGDGPRSAYLKEAFKSRPGRHFVGEKRGKEKAAYFKLAQVILNPGLVGLSIVDAFCAGLPLVTMEGSKHSPEIAYLQNGVNGIMTDDSLEAYSDLVIRLLKDDKRRKVLATNAFAAGEQYSIENMAENFVAGIVNCLSHCYKDGTKNSLALSEERR